MQVQLQRQAATKKAKRTWPAACWKPNKAKQKLKWSRDEEGEGRGREWNYRAAARQTTRHKYQRVTPIFTRRRVHFLVAAKILKRCDVTDYKTFDTSAKAAKPRVASRWGRRGRQAGRQTDEQQPRQAGRPLATRRCSHESWPQSEPKSKPKPRVAVWMLLKNLTRSRLSDRAWAWALRASKLPRGSAAMWNEHSELDLQQCSARHKLIRWSCSRSVRFPQ